MKKSYLTLGLAVLLSAYSCQTDDTSNENVEAELFKTYTTTATIKSNDLVESQMASAIDGQNNTHIVWVSTDNDVSSLKYTVFTASSKAFSTENIVAADTNQRFYAVDLAVDASGVPHISYAAKGTVAANNRNTGNLQVFYATKSGASFTTKQVSANPTDPTTDTDDVYNAFYEVRPSINVSSNGTPTIVYLSDNGAANGNEHQMVVAELSNGQWDLSIGTNVDDLSGTFDNTAGFATVANSGLNYAGYIDVTNNAPSYVYKTGSSVWQEATIAGYSGFTNTHAQLVKDNNGSVHYLWFHDDNNKMCHTILDGSTNTAVSETAVAEDHIGTFYPATVDLTTSNPVYYYEDIGDGFIMYTDKDGNKQTHKMDDTGLGDPMGRQVLNANNNYVSLVLGNVSGQQITVVVSND